MNKAITLVAMSLLIATTIAAQSTVAGAIDGHDYVDLGLPSGVKWATCNIGADSPSDYGDYFAWGEAQTKVKYTKGNSTTYKKSENEYIYLVLQEKIGEEHGTCRQRTNTKNSMKNCTWSFDDIDGHTGYTATSKINGNSIFFPCAGNIDGTKIDHCGGIIGACEYWSSTSATYDAKNIWGINFSILGSIIWGTIGQDRYIGRSIRPVTY